MLQSISLPLEAEAVPDMAFKRAAEISLPLADNRLMVSHVPIMVISDPDDDCALTVSAAILSMVISLPDALRIEIFVAETFEAAMIFAPEEPLIDMSLPLKLSPAGITMSLPEAAEKLVMPGADILMVTLVFLRLTALEKPIVRVLSANLVSTKSMISSGASTMRDRLSAWMYSAVIPDDDDKDLTCCICRVCSDIGPFGSNTFEMEPMQDGRMRADNDRGISVVSFMMFNN